MNCFSYHTLMGQMYGIGDTTRVKFDNNELKKEHWVLNLSI